MNGKLIIIEGLDGSGKSTQIKLLSEKIKSGGLSARFITFPDYNSLSGKIIAEYLKGEYCGLNEPDGAYAASCFYAADRYISFKTDWSKNYYAGVSIISARYTSSNLIYQTAKLPREKWDDYFKWLRDFEYGKLGLPKADAVIYLDMPPDISRGLLNKRYEENGGGKDLHEADNNYIETCEKAAFYAAEKENWIKISCARDGRPREVEDINTELLNIIGEILNDRIQGR